MKNKFLEQELLLFKERLKELKINPPRYDFVIMDDLMNETEEAEFEIIEQKQLPEALPK